MRQLIRKLQDPIIAFHPDFTIASINLATERLLGFPERELIGSNIPPVNPELRAISYRALRTQGTFEGCPKAFNGDGDIIDISIRAVAVHSNDEIAYLSVIRPVKANIERLYTLDETALILRKSTRTLRRMLAAGMLAGQKVGGTWRIPESELHRLTHPTHTDTPTADAPWIPRLL